MCVIAEMYVCHVWVYKYYCRVIVRLYGANGTVPSLGIPVHLTYLRCMYRQLSQVYIGRVVAQRHRDCYDATAVCYAKYHSHIDSARCAGISTLHHPADKFASRVAQNTDISSTYDICTSVSHLFIEKNLVFSRSIAKIQQR